MEAMSTLLVTHPACLNHQTGDYHPECADRLRAVLNALESEEFSTLHREAAPRASSEQILRAHASDYLDFLRENTPDGDGLVHLDPDTVVSQDSWEAVLRAAGAAVAAVDAVFTEGIRNAFCAVRPPGHHAGVGSSMGFCLLNNVAIGALHARHVHGAQRVAVIDFDVHHGNGTQEIFYDTPDLFYASTHQEDAFPGTGFPAETGIANNILNVPIPAGGGSEPWRRAMSRDIFPHIQAFAPQLIMLSAGFDAHMADPMADMRLTTDDFHWVTRQVCDLAGTLCGHRVVSVLEGGYDLRALAACSAAHVRALLGF
jgi:acetoin utilization deacetylase AcuC-like enzyme